MRFAGPLLQDTQRVINRNKVSHVPEIRIYTDSGLCSTLWDVIGYMKSLKI